MRRDSFARTELRRECVPNDGQSQTLGNQVCTWCGSRPKRLYRYGVESDGGRFYGFTKGAFCNIGCHDSYHS
jgi:hypothetical protein